MIAWATLADIGTAAGTLVLAGATFVAVRASARSTRIAERALLAGQRPVLAPAEQAGGVVYLAIPLRNVGAGLAVLSGYHLQGEPASHVAHDPGGPARHLRGDQPPQPRAFSPQQRDLLISTRRAGFWQAALRDPAIPRSRDPATPAADGGNQLPGAHYRRRPLRRPRGPPAFRHPVRAAARSGLLALRRHPLLEPAAQAAMRIAGLAPSTPV
ncbi:MAG TPA: hypothetical protein VKG80_15375 [Trebonia sp.]|nr:hypothetical protein [Trebonia sp.]